MTQETKFAEMLCTRFCHDIIGPVGAVNNGAEFLRDEMPSVKSQALDLIESSSKEAVSRVQFYRQAYGMGLADSVASLNETQNTVQNFFLGTKNELVWDSAYLDSSGIQINYMQKKLILNLVIIAAGALLRGGKITFKILNNGFELSITGQTLKLDPATETLLKLDHVPTEFDAKSVQIIYTLSLILNLGCKLNIAKNAESVNFEVKWN